MHIYLKHERHGTKVAICEAEAVADEANGWVRYELESRLDAPHGTVAGDILPDGSVVPLKRSPGRPRKAA